MTKKLKGRAALQVGLVCLVTAACSWIAHAQSAKLVPPSWAYLLEGKEPEPDDSSARTVPGSERQYTLKQIDNLSRPPDWFPKEHPPMPKVVGQGGSNGGLACASCHLTSGLGHPESSHLAGLPEAYLVRQLEDFRSGVRKDMFRMNSIAGNLTDEDIHDAAAWFAKLPVRKWTRVIEADEVPKSYMKGRLRLVVTTGEKEPLGDRIIELPEDNERAISRDPKSGFVAYVPRGAVARGKTLVRGGEGETVPCAACHGERLNGVGDVPRLAGSSPLYIARQLVAFRNGDRDGEASQPMKAVVEALTAPDVLAISAYLASLDP